MSTRAGARKFRTMWLGAAGCLVSYGLFQVYPMAAQSGANSGLLGEFSAGEGEAFITECMEAALMWKRDTVDFRLAATSQERSALRGQCSAAYASGEPTLEMREVRDGARLVRDGEEGMRTTNLF